MYNNRNNSNSGGGQESKLFVTDRCTLPRQLEHRHTREHHACAAELAQFVQNLETSGHFGIAASLRPFVGRIERLGVAR